MMKNNDRKILETLITKYGKSNVNLAINRLNEKNNIVNLNKPFYVTEDNVEYLIANIRNTYPEIHHTDVRGFFGEWFKSKWTFKSEWFTTLMTWVDLIDSFESWIFDKYGVDLNNTESDNYDEDDYDDLDESLNENYNFIVNEMGAISRNEMERHGWETQIRNVNKKSEDAIYASLYCWLPEGEYVDAVPEQLQSSVISWESNLFGFETEVGLVPDNAYLMHDGECVVINGYIRML